MDVTAVLRLFDEEMRIDPPPEAGLRYERRDGLVRVTNHATYVIYSRMSGTQLAAAIASEAAAVASRRQSVEWKIYGHDEARGLSERLTAHGFAPDEPETLMVLDLAGDTPPPLAGSGVVIRRVRDDVGLDNLIAVQTAVFGRDHPGMADEFRARLDDPTLALYVAYSGGTPVAGARLSLPPGRSFAGLWGGATLPGFRGRGIYRSLVAERAREARAQRYRYLTVEARETSRPILQRLGFVPLTSVVGWILRPPDPPPAFT
jgi:GNAT superfamily N-acetyltransferase